MQRGSTNRQGTAGGVAPHRYTAAEGRGFHGWRSALASPRVVDDYIRGYGEANVIAGSLGDSKPAPDLR